MPDDGAAIWVVEDDDQNFELVDFLLSEAGHRVTRAASEAELRRLLARPESPDLVLLDVSLPGRSGLELLAELRATPHRDVPVIALTAHAMHGDRERCLAAGCRGYLAKPIDTASFVAEVEGHLGAARPAPEETR